MRPFMGQVHGFGISDALDIALVAVFLYALFSWFRRAASRSVLVGLLSLGSVYVVARAFHMYMTTAVFHAMFAVLLVALIVVFQEDLRRGFERIASLGVPQGRNRRGSAAWVGTVVDITWRLKDDRVGALIVIKGKEPLDRHIHPGVRLDGTLSTELLESVFDTSSGGHDGAVIIEDGRVSQFAAHLPLSTKSEPVAPLGTRHRAALGMSEVSDALTIVVSEERGAVRLAEAGALTLVRSAEEVQRRIEAFLADRFPRSARARWKDILRARVGLKVLALLLAVAAWFFFSYSAGNVVRTFLVPVEYRNVPADLAIESASPREVYVTLAGNERAFTSFGTSALRVSIPLDDAAPGDQELTIRDEDVRYPPNVSLSRVEPGTVSVQVRRAPRGP